MDDSYSLLHLYSDCNCRVVLSFDDSTIVYDPKFGPKQFVYHLQKYLVLVSVAKISLIFSGIGF